MEIQALFEKGKVWTISNLLSLSRLFIGIIVYFLILNRDTNGAIILGVIGILSDYADGYLARKRNEVSELGKVLDPLADKIGVALVAIALHQSYGLPLWVVLVIVGRDVLIVLGAVIVMQHLKRVIASAIPGKIAVTIIALLLFSYLLQIYSVQPALLYLAMAAILYSFGYYSWKFLKYITENPERNDENAPVS